MTTPKRPVRTGTLWATGSALRHELILTSPELPIRDGMRQVAEAAWPHLFRGADSPAALRRAARQACELAAAEIQEQLIGLWAGGVDVEESVRALPYAAEVALRWPKSEELNVLPWVWPGEAPLLVLPAHHYSERPVIEGVVFLDAGNGPSTLLSALREIAFVDFGVL